MELSASLILLGCYLDNPRPKVDRDTLWEWAWARLDIIPIRCKGDKRVSRGLEAPQRPVPNSVPTSQAFTSRTGSTFTQTSVKKREFERRP